MPTQSILGYPYRDIPFVNNIHFTDFWKCYSLVILLLQSSGPYLIAKQNGDCYQTLLNRQSDCQYFIYCKQIQNKPFIMSEEVKYLHM